jgi:hypothetical protein
LLLHFVVCMWPCSLHKTNKRHHLFNLRTRSTSPLPTFLAQHHQPNAPNYILRYVQFSLKNLPDFSKKIQNCDH